MNQSSSEFGANPANLSAGPRRPTERTETDAWWTYWDKDGKQLTLMEWANLRETPEYRDIAHDLVTDEGNEYDILTVWLGDDPERNTVPEIFGTLVRCGGDEVQEVRYATLAEAQKGHAMLVEMYKTPRYKIGHVVEDKWGDIYAYSGHSVRPWVLVRHHHDRGEGPEHRMNAWVAEEELRWPRPKIIGQPVQPE